MNKKGGYVTWPFIICVLAFLGIAYLFFLFDKHQQTEKTQQFLVERAKDVKVSKLPDGWQRYEETRVGFSLDIPSNWRAVSLDINPNSEEFLKETVGVGFLPRVYFAGPEGSITILWDTDKDIRSKFKCAGKPNFTVECGQFDEIPNKNGYYFAYEEVIESPYPQNKPLFAKIYNSFSK